MFVKKMSACREFTANDGCQIRELLHPKNDPIDLPYSLALATVAVNSSSYRHTLEQTEIYHIQQGTGLLHINNETQAVEPGDVAVIPAKAVQWIDNTGETPLVFTAIVSPPWSEEGDIRL